MKRSLDAPYGKEENSLSLKGVQKPGRICVSDPKTEPSRGQYSPHFSKCLRLTWGCNQASAPHLLHTNAKAHLGVLFGPGVCSTLAAAAERRTPGPPRLPVPAAAAAAAGAPAAKGAQ